MLWLTIGSEYFGSLDCRKEPVIHVCMLAVTVKGKIKLQRRVSEDVRTYMPLWDSYPEVVLTRILINATMSYG